MGTANWPGGSSPTVATSFNSDPNNVYSDSVTLPQGRIAANGQGPVLITRAFAYMAGRGASRTAHLKVGTAETAGFTIASGSSAVSTGWRALSLLVPNGGTRRVECRANGEYYFGRSSSGLTTKPSSGFTWAGALSGQVDYVEVPSAPRSPSASPDPGAASVSLSWLAPSSDGGTAITGYRLEYDTDPAFGSPTVVPLGVVLAHEVTGLTPGETYYFRLAAENAVTDAASTWSVYSATASAFLGSEPDAPTGLAATAGLGLVSLTWAAPVDDGGVEITGYRVEWSTDAGFAGATSRTVGASTLAATITSLAPSTLYYFRVFAINSIGESVASGSASTTVLARTALELVRGASVHVSGGVQVELRSDGAASPTVTLGYIAFGTGSTFVSIATLPIGSGASDFAAPGGRRNFELVADGDGHLFVIGRAGDDRSRVLVRRYARSGPTTWAAAGVLSGALTDTGDSLVDFVGAFVPGSGGAPVPSIMLLARRAGSVGAGSVSFATISTAAVAASAGSLFIASGDDPAFLPSPPIGAAVNSGALDVAVVSGSRLALLAGGWAVVDVVNGAVTGVSKAADGTATAGPWARVLGVSASSFALLTVSAGALGWAVRTTAGALLGSGTYAAANATGAAFGDDWDAYCDRAAGVVTVYYLADTGSTRTLESIDVSPSTFAASAAAVLTTALGAVGSTNDAVRVPTGAVDERRVLVASANLASGTKSTAAYVDTSGNIAPDAPALVTKEGFDGSLAQVFDWAFSDDNTVDSQTAYELQVERVSDSASIVSTGKVTSGTASRTISGGTIANGQAYRWRVRTYDELDAVGAWSAWDTFTASALGNLTITSPAADNPAGLEVADVPIAWSFAQGDGYVQTQRRVRLIRVADSAVLSDTTMQASTATTYTVPSVPTDVPVRIELSIVTNAPGTPTVGPVARLLTTSYGLPMEPEAALEVGEAWVEITVDNPPPTGSRPATVLNYIERRETGSGDDFVAVGTAEPNGSYRDHAVRSSVGYDYRVKAVSA